LEKIENFARRRNESVLTADFQHLVFILWLFTSEVIEAAIPSLNLTLYSNLE
jgi:hypothetical protein|tara:strand:+ start:37 stop:192 length:156 start_codon:yes stop_codon:yes gene_type:complete